MMAWAIMLSSGRYGANAASPFGGWDEVRRVREGEWRWERVERR